MKKTVKTPLTEKNISELNAGDIVWITGYIYTARDAAHKRLVALLKDNQPLPFDLQGAVIYYVGPTPPLPGKVIGSAGPTTSSRMDIYAPLMIEKGLKGMIGKGGRSAAVKEAIQKHRAVYFIATGGAGALLSKHIKSAEIVAYEDLGPEAVRKLYVEGFPVIVANDIYGRDILEEGKRKFRIQ